MDSDKYTILESIKDGPALAGKYNSTRLTFKIPNILIVFANNELNMSKLSKNRLKIFKISKDSKHLEEMGHKGEKSKCVTNSDYAPSYGSMD